MKMLLNDEMCYAGTEHGWTTIFADEALVQQVMEIVDQGEMGRTVELIQTYEASVDRYNETGDSESLEGACVCERKLRIILKTGRFRRALGIE